MLCAIYRVKTVVLRHLIPQFRDVGRMLDLFAWPLIDILMFGFMSFFVVQEGSTYMPMTWIPIIGVLCWQVVAKSHLEIALNLFDELACKNLVNLFSSPMQLIEWIMGAMLLGCIRSCFVLIFWGTIAWIIFGINIFMLGWYLLPIMLALLCSGWILGLLAASMIIRYGSQMMRLIFVIGWCTAPFCGVYYPLERLPLWAQNIGTIFPATYTFKTIHHVMGTGSFDWSNFGTSIVLNILFFTCAVVFFVIMMRKAKKIGLARLEVD